MESAPDKRPFWPEADHPDRLGVYVAIVFLALIVAGIVIASV